MFFFNSLFLINYCILLNKLNYKNYKQFQFKSLKINYKNLEKNCLIPTN